MSDEQQGGFEAIAEKKVTDEMVKNARLLDELHRLSSAGIQVLMTMNLNQIQRVMKRLLKKATAEKVELKSQKESDLATFLDNYIGIYLLLNMNMENSAKQTKKELEKARKDAEKAYEEAVKGDGLSAVEIGEKI